METYFSPKGGCTEALVRRIGRARRSIHVQAFSFTSKAILAALQRALARGVKVQVLMDRHQSVAPGSLAAGIVAAGIPLRIDTIPGLCHNKVMIFDERTVATGSFNFSGAAERDNQENLVVVRGPKVAAAFLANWKACQRASQPFDPARPPKNVPKRMEGSP